MEWRDHMGLFGNKKRELPPLFSESADFDILPDAVSYDGVLDYLRGLGAADYATVLKVANIYRNADSDAAKALGIENEPSAFINPPEPPTLADSTFTDDDGRINLLNDDTELGNFLEDELPKPKKGKGKK